MKPGTIVLIMVVVLLLAHRGSAAEKHAMSGLVLEVSPSHRSMTVSCQRVPGYMDAMAMPFDVRDAKLLEGVKPGATIDFILGENRSSSFAENIRVRQYQNRELEPLEARRLAILSSLANSSAPKALSAQQPVPDFTLTDQNRNPISFSQLKGRVVAPELRLRALSESRVLLPAHQ